ncbi:hypothetical protein D3C71_2159030 [compost metagenome]
MVTVLNVKRFVTSILTADLMPSVLDSSATSRLSISPENTMIGSPSGCSSSSRNCSFTINGEPCTLVVSS